MTAAEIKWLQSYSGRSHTPSRNCVYWDFNTEYHLLKKERQQAIRISYIPYLDKNLLLLQALVLWNPTTTKFLLTLVRTKPMCLPWNWSIKSYADKQHILLIYLEQFYLLGRHSKSLLSLKFILYSDDFVDDTTVTKQMCGIGNILLANSHHSVKILFSLFYNPCAHFLLLSIFLKMFFIVLY